MRAMCAPKAKEGVEKSGHHSNGGLGRNGFFQPLNVNQFTRRTSLFGIGAAALRTAPWDSGYLRFSDDQLAFAIANHYHSTIPAALLQALSNRRS